MDYYWDHRMYLLKQKLLTDLRISRYFNQVFSFYELYNHITIHIPFETAVTISDVSEEPDNSHYIAGPPSLTRPAG